MAKAKKNKNRGYQNSSVYALANKLGLRGDTPHKVIAAKLIAWLGWEESNWRKALARYASEKPEIVGIVPFKPKTKTYIFCKSDGVDVVAGVASKEFLSSYEWRKLRMVALKKYGARCQCCGASPLTGAVMHVDHIKPRRSHPDLALDIDNLQVLCEACNHGKGNWDETDWRSI